jgi:hypothetical protein
MRRLQEAVIETQHSFEPKSDRLLGTPVAVSGQTTNTATVTGSLVSFNASAATVKLYWGTTDGGADQMEWGDSVDLGQKTGPYPEAFSVPLSGLAPLTGYYYRLFGTNTEGSNWSSPKCELCDSG